LLWLSINLSFPQPDSGLSGWTYRIELFSYGKSSPNLSTVMKH
jgi:hypothetical protein